MSNIIADTTIYIGDVAIHEPVTVLTDCFITGLSVFFYLQLNRFSENDAATRNWKYFFGLMSLSSFMGGCAHAFFEVHEGITYKFFWLSMQVLNIFSVYYMQLATLNSVLKNSSKKAYWGGSYKVQLMIATAAVFVFQNFLVIIMNTAAALIPVMVLHFLSSRFIKPNLWIAFGIVVLFATAFVNAVKLSIHDYFNHLDLAHVLIMINITCMFIGVKRNATALQFV